MSLGEADPKPKTLLYHYTNKAGYNSIRAGVVWRFKAGQPTPREHPVGAYFTPYWPGLPRSKLRMIFVPAEKREFVFVFEDAGDLRPLRGDRGRAGAS